VRPSEQEAERQLESEKGRIIQQGGRDSGSGYGGGLASELGNTTKPMKKDKQRLDRLAIYLDLVKQGIPAKQATNMAFGVGGASGEGDGSIRSRYPYR
jgi:hypothetical protein